MFPFGCVLLEYKKWAPSVDHALTYKCITRSDAKGAEGSQTWTIALYMYILQWATLDSCIDEINLGYESSISSVDLLIFPHACFAYVRLERAEILSCLTLRHRALLTLPGYQFRDLKTAWRLSLWMEIRTLINLSYWIHSATKISEIRNFATFVSILDIIISYQCFLQTFIFDGPHPSPTGLTAVKRVRHVTSLELTVFVRSGKIIVC